MQGLSFVGLLELFNYHTFVFFNLTKNILGVPLSLQLHEEKVI